MALNLSASVEKGLPMRVRKVLEQVDNSPIDCDLFVLQAEVFNIAHNWEALGRALHIQQHTLNRIKAEQGITTEQCLVKTLEEFLKNYDTENYGEPSWRLVVIAVAHEAGGNEPNLALEIATNHPIAGAKKTKHTEKMDFSDLMCACQQGDVETAQIILDAGADPNRQNSEGWTALMAAASNGHYGAVDLLLRHKIKPDIQDNTGWSALMAAVFKRHNDIALRLIEAGAKPCIQDNDSTNALLLAIATNEQGTVVDALLDHVQEPAELDIQDSFGETALIFTCKTRNLKLVERLLSMGANPNISNIRGETPSMIAISLKEREILKLLYKYNADPDKAGLHLAASTDTPSEDIVELVLSHGADPAQQDKHGVTAYQVAEAKNFTELAEKLKPKQLASETSGIGDVLKLTLGSLASLHNHLSRGPLFMNPDTDSTGGFSWLHF